MLNFILATISSLFIWYNVQTMWNWFLVPMGAIHITYLQAMALLLFVKYVQADNDDLAKLKNESDEETGEKLVYQIILSIVTLLLAWLVHVSM